MNLKAKEITVEVYDEDRRWYSFNRKREYKDVWVIIRDETVSTPISYISIDRWQKKSQPVFSYNVPILLNGHDLFDNNNKWEINNKYIFTLTEEKCNEYINFINDQDEKFKLFPKYKLKTKCDEFKIFEKKIYYGFDKRGFHIFTNYLSTGEKIETKEQGLAFIEYENCVLKQEWVDVE